MTQAQISDELLQQSKLRLEKCLLSVRRDRAASVSSSVTSGRQMASGVRLRYYGPRAAIHTHDFMTFFVDCLGLRTRFVV